MPEMRRGAVRAPELTGGFGWLNTDRPLRLRPDLVGQVVLLDFWTSCCINCLHTLPVLAELERELASEPFQIIGIHSGKFDAEQDASMLEATIARLAVRHPVIIDDRFHLWNQYTVKAWPTLVLIDAAGYVVSQVSGEPDLESLRRRVRAVLEEGRSRGLLAAHKVELVLPPVPRTGPLAFPGKVTAQTDGRIIVSDSGHNRIVVLGPTGATLTVIGSGLAGIADGTFENAAFRNPQGVAAAGEVLYVADTGNHALRRIDLLRREVTTLAGTGEKGHTFRITEENPRAQPLRSPWDVVLHREALIIAMAGTHQLWRYDLIRSTLESFAGTGRESLVDGLQHEAWFAQPSGLALDEHTLYIVDAESSAIRALDLITQEVTTVVGRGLYSFGAEDGSLDQARLQHPLSVVARGEVLYVADTFNHRIRIIDRAKGTVRTLTHGEPEALFEPGGLTWIGERLLVADTNHHRLRWVDPETGAMEDLALTGLRPPALRGWRDVSSGSLGRLEEETLVELAVASEGAILELELRAPPGRAFTPRAPHRVERIDAERTSFVPHPEGEDRLTLALPVPSVGPLHLEVTTYLCESEEAQLCHLSRRALRIPLARSPDAPARARLEVPVDPGSHQSSP